MSGFISGTAGRLTARRLIGALALSFAITLIIAVVAPLIGIVIDGRGSWHLDVLGPRALDAAAAHKPARRPRVLAVIDREAGGLGNLVSAGPGSWVDELLAVVGAENVLAAAPVRYPKISAEEVLRARPDVILDLSYAARQSVDAWRAVDVPAVATHRVRALQDAYLIAPSPRVAAALAALARAIE